MAKIELTLDDLASEKLRAIQAEMKRTADTSKKVDEALNRSASEGFGKFGKAVTQTLPGMSALQDSLSAIGGPQFGGAAREAVGKIGEELGKLAPRIPLLSSLGTRALGMIGPIGLGAAAIAGLGVALSKTGIDAKTGESNLGRLLNSAKDLGTAFLPTTEIIKGTDKAVTRFTSTITENINALTTWIDKTAAARRKQSEAKDDLQRMVDVNKQIAESAKKRADAEELAGVRSIAEIDRRLDAALQSRARAAKEGNFTEADAKKAIDLEASLQARRTQLIQEQQAKRNEIAKAAAEFQQKMSEQATARGIEDYKRLADAAEKSFQRILDDRLRMINEATDAEIAAVKKADLERSFREKAAAVRNESLMDTNRQREKRARELAEAELALIEHREEQRKKRFRDEADADQDAKRAKQLAAQQDAAQKAIEIEQQKQQALKQARGEALEKAGLKGEDVLGMGKRFDVLKNLQEQARARAQQQTGEANQELRARADIDPEARAQYARLQRKAQEEAMRGAARDLNLGRTDPQQLAQAQAQAAQKQLGALQQQGKLSGDSVQAMSELIQATAQQQATTQALQRQVDQMAAAAKALNQGAGQQRQAAQRGVLN